MELLRPKSKQRTANTGLVKKAVSEVKQVQYYSLLLVQGDK